MLKIHTPALMQNIREGYTFALLKRDVFAGLIVAIVALPLSMAIAIASGLSPEKGLYTAIFGGFLVSLLGGSRFQIGGPAGAFIALLASITMRHGYEGVVIATMISGVLILLIGLLNFGKYIRLIPDSVIIGFTAAIGVIIFMSQIFELFGLFPTLNTGGIGTKLQVLITHLTHANLYSIGLALTSLIIFVLMKRYAPKFPAYLALVALISAIVAIFNLPVETIGTRFGTLPTHLPVPHMPDVSMEKLLRLLPDALSLALLGAIESLLSALVADKMTNTQHEPDSELVAQGIANIVAPLFSGFAVTGTLARTATNIRSHAATPISGILHAVFLLLLMLFCTKILERIPLVALASILAIVCWHMIERKEIMHILQQRNIHSLMLLVTCLTTIFYGLLQGIGLGLIIYMVYYFINQRAIKR